MRAQILNLMQDLQEKKDLTYMFITHDLSVVRHISQNICIVYLGQMEHLLLLPRHRCRYSYAVANMI